ncbi:MAG TPA: DNA-binding transcriptional regulator [Opitutaceae bacterium]|jgi:LacI family transcriptional regulator|nr:DNA-binding transcriptional regulator [Opitutaceae bacterium]
MRALKRPEVLLIFRPQFEECTSMLKGIAHYERSHGAWTAFHDDLAVAETDPKWIREGNWKGVISRHTTAKLVAACKEMNVPLVDLNDVAVFEGVPKIRPDNATIGRLGAEHLLERGYSSFGFAGFTGQAWSAERRDGFVEALRRAGQDCNVLDVHCPESSTPSWNSKQLAKIAEWLGELSKPTAVMACNDLRAQQLINAAGISGISVPEDLAILGANNETFRCEMTIPALSSVAPNAFQSGFRAASLLAEMLAGGKPQNLDQRVEPLGVVTRLSTDSLAIDDEKIAEAVNYIRKNACSGLTPDQVAENSHISRSLLEKKFRKYIGRSPQAEIRRVQVNKISELLIDTDYPLKRVAELTGFEYTEYMSVLFKRVTGHPPGEYREKMQDKAGVRSTVDIRSVGAAAG